MLPCCSSSAARPTEPDLAVQMLRHEGVRVKTESTHCLIKAAEMLAAAAAARSLGVLWTRHTAVAMCLANRNKSLRAVQAANVPATATAVAAVGGERARCRSDGRHDVREESSDTADSAVGGVRECPEELK